MRKPIANPGKLTENSDNTVETQDFLHTTADKLIKINGTLNVTNDPVKITHRLYMELDLPSLFGLPCTAVLIG